MSENTSLTVIESLKLETTLQSFLEVVGDETEAHKCVKSVIVAVMKSDDLKKCTAASIISEAIRAQTLGLSCDPAMKQAALVAIRGKAELWPQYKGYYDLNMATGNYVYINSGKIWEGEEIEIDRISGAGKIIGQKISDKIIGYFAAMKLKTGMEKVIYKSIEELDEFMMTHNPKGFKSEHSAWAKNKPRMYAIKVLKMLLTRWGIPLAINAYNESDALEHEERLLEDEDGEAAEAVEDRGGEIIDVDMETGEIIEPEIVTGEVTATDFWKRAKELGVELEISKGILKEVKQHFGDGLMILNKQYAG